MADEQNRRETLYRIPGLFRRWELGSLLVAGEDYRLEDAGRTEDGTALLAVYCGMRHARASGTTS